MMRHMDDFLQIGPKHELEKVQRQMSKEMLLRDIVYLDKPGDTVQFLGWQITRTMHGFDVAVNEQLARDIVSDAGLETTTRTTHVPGMKERLEDETPCDAVDHRYYRTQVGRLLYYGALRADMQFAIKELARDVQAPTQASLNALKRCIRYLRSSTAYVLHLTPRGRLRLIGYADSDWAGAADRRSTSGGILLLAGCCVLSYARTQASRAQSSCEAELYALGSCAVEALQLASLLAEQGWGCGAALGLQRQQQCADFGGAKRTRPPQTRRDPPAGDPRLERGRPATVGQSRHLGQPERLAYEARDTIDYGVATPTAWPWRKPRGVDPQL